MKITWCSNIIW